MVYRVFISFSSNTDDLPIINQAASQLQAGGVECYVSSWFRQPGQDIGEKVRSAIRASDAFLAVWTKGGSEAQWVNQELGFADALGKPTVLLVEEGVRVKGFRQNMEYISFNRKDPGPALSVAANHFSERRQQKEASQKAAAAVGLAAAGIIGGLLAWKYLRDRDSEEDEDDDDDDE